MPSDARLSLVHDQNTHEDEKLPGCEGFPVWWTPHAGVTHNGSTIGIKYRCERCGFDGQGIFGPARDLPEIAQEALKAFINSDAAKASCIYWTTPVDHYVPQ